MTPKDFGAALAKEAGIGSWVKRLFNRVTNPGAALDPVIRRTRSALKQRLPEEVALPLRTHWATKGKGVFGRIKAIQEGIKTTPFSYEDLNKVHTYASMPRVKELAIIGKLRARAAYLDDYFGRPLSNRWKRLEHAADEAARLGSKRFTSDLKSQLRDIAYLAERRQGYRKQLVDLLRQKKGMNVARGHLLRRVGRFAGISAGAAGAGSAGVYGLNRVAAE